MSYKEKDLTSEFSRWLRKSPEAWRLQFSFVCEYKVKHGNETLHLIRDFQPQQIPSLVRAATGCVYMKHSDMSAGLKPYDATQSCFVPAFVGVMWYVPRQPKILYLINANIIKAFIDEGDYKFKRERAELLCAHRIDLSIKMS